MKKLGVIGGLGPMASAYYLERITQMTSAAIDQEHIEVLLHSCPQIPDRTGYILGESSSSPLPKMLEVGKNLAAQGVDMIAIPCITAHYFEEDLSSQIPVPIIDALSATADYLSERGIQAAGLMATDGTVKSGLFQKRLQDKGIKCILPDEDNQRAVMAIIYDDVKSGKPINYEKFQKVIRSLKGQGADVVILGCTELSVVKRDFTMPPGVIDVIDVLSRAAVLRCGKLKPEYEELIT